MNGIELRMWLLNHNLTQTWLIRMLRLKGLDVDKSTMSSAIAGSITGERVNTIFKLCSAVIKAYEQFETEVI